MDRSRAALTTTDEVLAINTLVEFTADKADLVAGRVWHPTQELTRIAGGRLRLTFTCTNLVPVVSWALQRGPHVRVIEPTELVDAVVDELDRD